MFKPYLEAIQTTSACSFLVRAFDEEAFSSPYHFHPEYELTLITKGSGKRYVGNHMDQYETGDLVLIGANLPHCWKSESIIKNEKNAGSIVVQFTHDFLGEEIFSRPEFSHVVSLLQKSSCGLVFGSTILTKAMETMKHLSSEKESFQRLMLLLQLLQGLATTKDYTVLNNDAALLQQPSADRERIHLVMAYIIEHFTEKISLRSAAAIACMTTTAFCKYFKQATKKTFVEAVNHYRLNHATAQLLHTAKPIAQICFESGFNDIAYFSRLFKKKMKQSPLQYRKLFGKSFS